MRHLIVTFCSALIFLCDVLLVIVSSRKWEHLRFRSRHKIKSSTVDTKAVNYHCVGSGRYYNEFWMEYSTSDYGALRYFGAQNFHDNIRGEFRLADKDKPFTGIEAAAILN